MIALLSAEAEETGQQGTVCTLFIITRKGKQGYPITVLIILFTGTVLLCVDNNEEAGRTGSTIQIDFGNSPQVVITLGDTVNTASYAPLHLLPHCTVCSH